MIATCLTDAERAELSRKKLSDKVREVNRRTESRPR